jgi:hypothetical protein
MNYLKIFLPVFFIHLFHRWEYYYKDRDVFYMGSEDESFKHEFLHKKCKKCGKVKHRDKIMMSPMDFEFEHWHNN